MIRRAILVVVLLALAAFQFGIPLPERWEWERTVRNNVGEPYLSQYLAAKDAGEPSPWDYVADDPNLPRVLLIGDSISRSYTLPVRELLAGKANVHRAPQNCLHTGFGLSHLNLWLGEGRWDVIHFNFGIHDWRNSPATYERNLDLIATRLQATGARVVFATTTNVPADAAGIAKRNEIARRVMARHGIPIDELADFRGEQIDGIHFTAPAARQLGERVAASIAGQLSGNATP